MYNLACVIESPPFSYLEKTRVFGSYYISDDWTCVHDCEAYGKRLIYIEPGFDLERNVVLYSNWSHIYRIPWEWGVPIQAVLWKGQFYEIRIAGDHMHEYDAAHSTDYYQNEDRWKGHPLNDRFNEGYQGIPHHPVDPILDQRLADPLTQHIYTGICDGSITEDDMLVYSDWVEDHNDPYLADILRRPRPNKFPFIFNKLLRKMQASPCWRTFRLLLIHCVIKDESCKNSIM